MKWNDRGEESLHQWYLMINIEKIWLLSKVNKWHIVSTIQRSEKYLKDMFFLSKANARHIVSIIQKSEEQRSEENNTRAFQVTFMQR